MDYGLCLAFLITQSVYSVQVRPSVRLEAVSTGPVGIKSRVVPPLFLPIDHHHLIVDIQEEVVVLPPAGHNDVT